MSDTIASWVPFLLFVLLFVGVIAAETFLIARKGWASTGSAAGYTMISDLLGLAIGSFIVFVIVLIMFMAVMGPAGHGSDVGQWFYIVAIILGVIIPPVLLFLIKRLFLRVFKIRSGGEAWTYAAISSVLTFAVYAVPPPLVFYILLTVMK